MKEVILVLGKKLQLTEKGEELTVRGRQVTEAAAELYNALRKDGREVHVVFSGGFSTSYNNDLLRNLGLVPTVSEARKMSDEARLLGVKEQHMTREEHSSNRLENLVMSKREILDKKFMPSEAKIHVVFDAHHEISVLPLIDMVLASNGYSCVSHPVKTYIPIMQRPFERIKELVVAPYFKRAYLKSAD
ncbi:MAG: YdcF family protein [Candidatus Micrarchaeota archaeon]|nr:YdcF family protein [Candidatus Micrarchaeota archaeon]